jgi:hypothetical protein
MRKLLRCRRGSIALGTVVALVPLVGALALGGEAASWYVTKQNAQNAADSAAYSGALRLACSIPGSGTCATDAHSVAYRGKEFAAQQAYCNSGDTAYPGSRCSTLAEGVSQSVAIDIGTYSSGTWTTSASGSYVRAKVQQTQPAYLTALLGVSTINIPAQAIAQVKTVFKPCTLALTGPISFQGSPNINSPNCGLASNDTANNALDFTGGGMTMNVGSLTAAGGCKGASSFCSSAMTYQPTVTNPFAALDAVILPSLSTCSGNSALTAYSAATPCRNDNVKLTGNSTINLTGGVYFISGKLTLTGTTAIAGTALFVLLPGASFDMKGTGTINVTANASLTAAQLPAVLRPYASPSSSTCVSTNTCLLNNMVLYDQSNVAVTIGGNSQISFGGDMYAPNAAVTYQGNPTVNACGQLVAASIAFNGNATFDNSGCSALNAPTPVTQSVALVQ